MNTPYSFDDHGPSPVPGAGGGYFKPLPSGSLELWTDGPLDSWVGASNGDLLTSPRAVYNTAPTKVIDLDAIALAYGLRPEILTNMAFTEDGKAAIERMWDQMSELNKPPKDVTPAKADPLWDHIKTTVDADILRRINRRVEREAARKARRPLVERLRALWNHPVEMWIFIAFWLTIMAMIAGFQHGERMAAKAAFQAGYQQAQEEHFADQIDHKTFVNTH